MKWLWSAKPASAASTARGVSVAASCVDAPPFVCHEDVNCDDRSATAHCWHSPAGYDTCAYEDARCASGWRWDDSDALTTCVAVDNVCPSLETNACN